VFWRLQAATVPHHLRSLDPALCNPSFAQHAQCFIPDQATVYLTILATFNLRVLASPLSPPSIKMATDNNGVKISASSLSDGDDAIEIAIRTQTSLATSFQQWLAQKRNDDGDRNDVIARVQLRLDSYKQWLLEANTVPITVLKDVEPWDMSARVQPGDEDGSVIIVTGPGSGEPIEIATKDEGELRYLMSDNYLGYMIKICNAFSKTQETLRLLLRTASELQDAEAELRCVLLFLPTLRSANTVR
jgi:hypothetical protein